LACAAGFGAASCMLTLIQQTLLCTPTTKSKQHALMLWAVPQR